MYDRLLVTAVGLLILTGCGPSTREPTSAEFRGALELTLEASSPPYAISYARSLKQNGGVGDIATGDGITVQAGKAFAVPIDAQGWHVVYQDHEIHGFGRFFPSAQDPAVLAYYTLTDDGWDRLILLPGERVELSDINLRELSPSWQPQKNFFNGGYVWVVQVGIDGNLELDGFGGENYETPRMVLKHPERYNAGRARKLIQSPTGLLRSERAWANNQAYWQDRNDAREASAERVAAYQRAEDRRSRESWSRALNNAMANATEDLRQYNEANDRYRNGTGLTLYRESSESSSDQPATDDASLPAAPTSLVGSAPKVDAPDEELYKMKMDLQREQADLYKLRNPSGRIDTSDMKFQVAPGEKPSRETVPQQEALKGNIDSLKARIQAREESQQSKSPQGPSLAAPR